MDDARDRYSEQSKPRFTPVDVLAKSACRLQKMALEGLDRKSSNWMNKAAEIVWKCTHGVISKETMDAVRSIALTKYKCIYSRRKVLYFTKGLLK